MTPTELNDATATEVMGWTRDTWVETEGWEAGMRLNGPWKTRTGIVPLWRPVADLEQAFKVVNCLIERGFTFELFFGGSRGWGVDIVPKDTHLNRFIRPRSSYGETPAVAICRGALDAVRTFQ